MEPSLGVTRSDEVGLVALATDGLPERQRATRFLPRPRGQQR